MKTFNERIESIIGKAEAQRLLARRRLISRVSVLSVLLVLILVLNLVLFIPFETGGIDISAYKDSEYYELIGKISSITSPRYTTNNFERWGLGNIKKSGMLGWENGAVSNQAPTSPNSSSSAESNSSSSYQEVTDNQVAGVTEGDLFKRSDKYIYTVSYKSREYTVDEHSIKRQIPACYILRIYAFGMGELTLTSELLIQSTNGSEMKNNGEIYLSEDCSTVTLVTNEYSREVNACYTTLINIDVTNVESPVETERKMVSGEYVSSRMVDGSLLVITNFNIPYYLPDFDDTTQYIPQVGDANGVQSLPMQDIVVPDDADTINYTVIAIYDNASLAQKDVTALFSYTAKVYVSQNSLYAIRSVNETITHEEIYCGGENAKQYDWSYTYTVTNTEITAVGYGNDGLSINGTIKVDGFVLNQYNVDEYENVLRVVTTSTKRLVSFSGSSHVPTPSQVTDECNLYCYDLTDFSMKARVENFCKDEQVKSVRFDGETAYVCTAFVDHSWITDPVFKFDLSDYDNITYTDTGTIPGYSLSLTKFTDGTLIGIGYGDTSDTLKIELYRDGDGIVDCVTKYELYNCIFSSQYKAYFIDAERGLVGLAVEKYDNINGWGTSYLLLHYDGKLFREVGFYQFTNIGGYDVHVGMTDYARACYVDGYVYMFCETRVATTKV